MSDAQQEDALQQLVQRIIPGSTLRRARRLSGGGSAEVTALEVEQPDGQTTKLLLRRHGEIDRTRNPHIARDELRLLQIAQSHGLAAPKPYYLDESCQLLPTPYLVIAYIAGDTDFAPSNLADYTAQTATQLAKIHGVTDTPEIAFLPRQDRGFGERPTEFDTSMNEEHIRDALEAAWPLAQINPSVLLHGDYWPGNILWHDGRLAAVIDWEDAAVGDPLADLANCRLESLWWFGLDAMNDFTDRYRSLAPLDVANLPYWDLAAALRPCAKISTWGLDDTTEQRLRALHHDFVTHALAAISSR